jgi:diguanylate cyclase (GGDEF)-like protein/PAS domain S-box-containing protein
VDWEAEYQDLLEFVYLVPVGIIKFQPDGKITMANPSAARFLMPLTANGGMANVYELFADIMPDLRARAERFEEAAGQIFEEIRLPVTGTAIVLTLGVSKINAETLMAVIRDVTLAVEQEERIRADQMRLSAIFENVRDYAIYTTDPHGYIDEWNRSLSRLGGWEAADTRGSPIDIFFPPGPEGHTNANTLLERARLNGRDEYEGNTVRKDGHWFWSSTVATVLPDRKGNANGYVLITRDIGEQKAREDALAALATTDPLTGIGNRRTGGAYLNDAFGRWKRYGRIFSVLMIDCDHFKSINDRWGHDIGDKVLVALARIWREHLRDSDIAIRWGGEEFLMVLPETGLDAAIQVAERLREAIEAAEIPGGSQLIKVTVSVGVAESNVEDSVPDDVVQRADRALYLAKRNGRNRVAS